MAKKNTIIVRTYPNSRTKFEHGGWPVYGEPSGTLVMHKERKQAVEVCYERGKIKISVFSVDKKGDLDDLLAEYTY